MGGNVSAWKPLRISPEPELVALRRFLFDKGTALGTVKANLMGPGAPEMQAVARWSGGPIVDGLWFVGDYQQDQFKDDEFVLTWKAHMVPGWDGATRAYQGYFLDSNRVAAVCTGRIDG
jgi:hypothetical protein